MYYNINYLLLFFKVKIKKLYESSLFFIIFSNPRSNKIYIGLVRLGFTCINLL